MSLKDRFSEELRYLHELGNDFATDNPQLARLLGKGGSDPDVERLMEALPSSPPSCASSWRMTCQS